MSLNRATVFLTVIAVMHQACGDGPSFDRCQGSEYCTRKMDSREFQLACAVRGAKADVTMTLEVEGNSNLTILPPSFLRREDGTLDQSLYANVSLNSDSSSETFTCTARGEGVLGNATATIIVKVTSGFPKAATAVIIMVLILLAFGPVCFVVFKRNVVCRKRGDERKDNCCSIFSSRNKDDIDCEESKLPLVHKLAPLQKLRTKINNYKPGDATGIKLITDEVILGLFGKMSHGKSTFINSVMFALKGEYVNCTGECEKELNMSSDSCGRTPYPLTDCITLLENIALDHYSSNQTGNGDQTGNKIESGDSGKGRMEIHCPIFVANPRDEYFDNDMKKFVYALALDIQKEYGEPLKFVFTRKSDMDSRGLTVLELFPRISKDDMIAIDNYTLSDHTESVERSTELLKFIWGCLETAERVIEPLERKITERKKSQKRNRKEKELEDV